MLYERLHSGKTFVLHPELLNIKQSSDENILISYVDDGKHVGVTKQTESE